MREGAEHGAARSGRDARCLTGGVGVGTCQSFSVKGKIFTENMTVMDLEDGEFQWRRSPVSHAIRIKNESKNKWCVSA